MRRAWGARLLPCLAVAVALAGPRVARAECDDKDQRYWPSCKALDGQAIVIGQMGIPQYVRIPVGESTASGMGIGVSVGYRYRSLVVLGEFVGVFDEPLTATRNGLTARLFLWHLPFHKHFSVMVYAEGGLGRQSFRWEGDDGTIERTLHRTDGLVGMGVAHSFRIGEAMAYRISLGARVLGARRPFVEDDTEPRERCGTCVDRGYQIAGSMSFDF